MVTERAQIPAERAQIPAWEVAASVVDPELPMLTLADLGVLRSVEVTETGVVVAITPTYSGCPATATMRDDLVRALTEAGYAAVDVRLQLSPAWTTDDLTDAGREKLRRHGLSAPGPVTPHTGPIPLTLGPVRRPVTCPRCGSTEGRLRSEFGPTACTALYVCGDCAEPFEHMKEI